MRRIALLIMLIISFAFASAAVGPDMFQEIASLPLQGMNSFDVDSANVCLLFDHAVAIAKQGQPGIIMNAGKTTPLTQRYTDCYLHERRLYLYSRDGAFGVAEVDNGAIDIVEEQATHDTILSVVAAGSYLYLAQGFDGITIMNANDAANLHEVGKARHGAYYSLLKIYDTLLFAADRLNGVDVYRVSDSALVYLQTFLTYLPVVDFVLDSSNVLTCYGTDRVDKWNLFSSSDTPITFEHEVTHLDNLGIGVVVGFSNGSLETNLSGNGPVLGTQQLAFPARKLRTVFHSGESAQCFALDEVGRLTVLSGDDLTVIGQLRLSNLPTSITANGDGLIVAQPGRGISRLKFESGIFTETLLYESGLAFTSLCQQESLLFAAIGNSDSVLILDLDVTPAKPMMFVDMMQLSSQVYVNKLPTIEYEIVAIGPSGARAVKVDLRDKHVAESWSVQAAFPVTSGYYDRQSLVFASETGQVDYYCVDCGSGQPEFRASITTPAPPRSLLMIDGQYLVVGSAGGAGVYVYNQSQQQLELVTDLYSVLSTSQLLYDPSRKLLIIAGGSDFIRYVDLSDPSSPGPIYNLPTSGGASSISMYGSELYAVENDAVTLFRSNASGVASNQSNEVVYSEPYPNPFNSATAIEVQASDGSRGNGQIGYQIVDVLGRFVREGQIERAGGATRIIWDGTDADNRPVASGVYFLRLSSGESVSVRKMLLIK